MREPDTGIGTGWPDPSEPGIPAVALARFDKGPAFRPAMQRCGAASDDVAVVTVVRAVSIALLLMWPAAAPRAETGFNPPHHSAAQRAEAKRAYEDCLFRAASRLDDVRSDPGVIADAMRGLCIEQQFQMADAIADGARRSYLILSGMDRYRADALKAVLFVRGAASATEFPKGRTP